MSHHLFVGVSLSEKSLGGEAEKEGQEQEQQDIGCKYVQTALLPAPDGPPSPYSAGHKGKCLYCAPMGPRLKHCVWGEGEGLCRLGPVHAEKGARQN